MQASHFYDVREIFSHFAPPKSATSQVHTLLALSNIFHDRHLPDAPGPYFIKVKILELVIYYVLANSLNFEFLLTLMLILFTISKKKLTQIFFMNSFIKQKIRLILKLRLKMILTFMK